MTQQPRDARHPDPSANDGRPVTPGTARETCEAKAAEDHAASRVSQRGSGEGPSGPAVDEQLEALSRGATILPGEPGFHMVGIGASAGGLEALEALFSHLPANSGMAFVVVQHLSPDFESQMDELLQRHTSMPVQLVEHGMPVAADHVYLIPPRSELILSGDRLLLSERRRDDRPAVPIDVFFGSLAREAGSMSVGIILSGTGSDGSRGICEIHAAGGVVLAQDPASARFDGMPRSALATGMVDLVDVPERIPLALMRLADQSGPTSKTSIAGSESSGGLARIFQSLQRDYGVDFSVYKTATVTRRLERRLSLTRTTSYDEYARIFEREAAERHALYSDLLIGVTHFFRDQEAYEALQREVIPQLVNESDPEEEIRIWSAGCATGEEPYSIALVLHEYLEQQQLRRDVKIFATDIDRRSLNSASAGVYSEESLREVVPERRERYFSERDGAYHVASPLRKMIIFAPHNVLGDAPFTRLDLVVCRNMLIYLQPEAQKKALSLFHFGLRTGGFLFLGHSETPGDLSEEFEAINKSWRLYRKRREVALPSINSFFVSSGRRANVPASVPERPHGPADLLKTYDLLLAEYMPDGVLIDAEYRLVHVFGSGTRYLKINPGRPSQDLLDLILPELRTTIVGAVQHVVRSHTPVKISGTRIRLEENAVVVNLVVKELRPAASSAPQILILFEQTGETAGGEKPAELSFDESTRSRIDALESELHITKENLQATIEELRTSNEELQASNQELVAANEELQGTNEELHSVNEELHTVNTEYQRKIIELTEMTNDMDNLLESTDLCVIYLDRDLRIRRFTPRVATAFHLLPQDLGRALDDFAHTIDHERLADDVRRVLNDNSIIEREVRDRDGRFYFLRILPYRTKKGIEGVLLTLIDIQTLKESEDRIRDLTEIVESADLAVLGKDLDGIVTSWNRGAERLYGYTAEQAIGQRITFLVADELKGEVEEFLERLRRGESIEHVHTVRKRSDGSPVYVSLTIWPLRNKRQEITGAAAIARDITQERLAVQQLEAREAQFRSILESITEAVVAFDRDWQYVYVNETAETLLGRKKGDLLGRRVWDLFPEVHGTEFAVKLRRAVEERQTVRFEDFYAPQERWYECFVFPSADGASVFFSDTTERRQSEIAIRDREERIRLLLDSTAEGIYGLDLQGNCTFCNAACLRLLGYDALHELLGRNMHDLIHHHRRDGSAYPVEECSIYRAFRAGEGTHVDDEVLFRKDGSSFPVEYWSYPIRRDGETLGAVVTFIDVTEKRHVEEQLNRLASIVESTSDVVGICSTEQKVLMLNRAARETFQIALDADLSQLDLTSFHTPWAGRLLIEEAIPTAIQEGSWSGESALRLPDGREMPVSQVLVAHYDENRQVDCLSTIIRDITNIKLTEDSLRLHQRAVDAATNGIVIADAHHDNRIVYANRGFEALTGYGRREAVGRNCRFLQGPGTSPEAVGRIREAIRSERECRVTLLNYRKDGRPFWNDLHITPVRDKNGALTGFVGILTDVTERVAFEGKLKQRNQMLRTLIRTNTILAGELERDKLLQLVTDAGRELSNAEVGAFFHNVPDEQGGSYMLYTLSGVAAEHFAKFPMPRKTKLFASTFDGHGITRLDDVTKDPRYGKNEPYFGMPEGHLPICSYLAVPVVSRDGEVFGGLFYGHSKPGVFTEEAEQLVAGMAAQAAVAIDNARLYNTIRQELKERERTERLLHDAKKAADAANRAKSAFLANMSHEIRTPMTTVCGIADLLLSHEQDPEKAEMLHVLKESGNHLVEIINDVLDLSRIEAGRLKVERVRFSPRQVVDNICAMLKPKADEKGLELRVDFDDSLPETITSDPVRVRQILLNLIGNAVKFTDRGHIQIQGRLIPADDHSQIEFQVNDTGVGISKDDQARLFRPFMQADESVSRRFGGTGLGLVISQRLAEALGGSIEVTSKVGQGSQFTVTLAADLVPPDAACEISELFSRATRDDIQSQDLRGVEVLVAEDTKGIQFLLRRILEAAGAEVTVVATGQEAIQRIEARTSPFDVVLMDIHMPELDGYQATRQLRTAGYTVPIIALTANAMQGDRDKCLAAGCNDYLPKPIDRQELLNKLKKVIYAAD